MIPAFVCFIITPHISNETSQLKQLFHISEVLMKTKSFQYIQRRRNFARKVTRNVSCIFQIVEIQRIIEIASRPCHTVQLATCNAIFFS